MPEGHDRTLLLKVWVMHRFKDARGPLSQVQAAHLLTELMRSTGALRPPKVVLPQSVMQWEQRRSAPGGRRLTDVVRWMSERLAEQPPVPLAPERAPRGAPVAAKRR